MRPGGVRQSAQRMVRRSWKQAGRLTADPEARSARSPASGPTSRAGWRCQTTTPKRGRARRTDCGAMATTTRPRRSSGAGDHRTVECRARPAPAKPRSATSSHSGAGKRGSSWRRRKTAGVLRDGLPEESSRVPGLIGRPRQLVSCRSPRGSCPTARHALPRSRVGLGGRLDADIEAAGPLRRRPRRAAGGREREADTSTGGCRTGRWVGDWCAATRRTGSCRTIEHASSAATQHRRVACWLTWRAGAGHRRGRRDGRPATDGKCRAARRGDPRAACAPRRSRSATCANGASTRTGSRIGPSGRAPRGLAVAAEALAPGRAAGPTASANWSATRGQAVWREVTTAGHG